MLIIAKQWREMTTLDILKSIDIAVLEIVRKYKANEQEKPFIKSIIRDLIGLL